MKKFLFISIFVGIAGIATCQNSLDTILLPSAYSSVEMKSRSGFGSDADGHIWVGFKSKGLAEFDGSNWTLYTEANCPLPSDTITTLFVRGNKVCAGTPHGLGLLTPGGWIVYDTGNGLPENMITGVYINDDLLILTTISYLCILPNGGTWNIIHLPFSTPYYGSWNFNQHIPIEVDGYGNIVFSKYGMGIYKYNGSTFSTITFNNSIVSAKSLALDNQGNIWAKSGYGLLVLVNNTLFKTEVHYPNSNWADAASDLSLITDNNGTVYMIGSNKISWWDGTTSSNFYFNGSITNPFLTIIGNKAYMLPFASTDSLLFCLDMDPSTTFNGGPGNGNFKYLNINNVNAGFWNRGCHLIDPGFNMAGFEVPAGSGKHTIFSNALWVGGYDANDQLHLSATKGYNMNTDFYPGPLYSSGPSTGSTDTVLCLSYDSIWKIERNELEAFQSSWNTSSPVISPVIANWPAMTVNLPGTDPLLAPFWDENSDGYYNNADGDCPRMRGDQMLWWIMNDALSYHEFSQTPAMGIEIRTSAYAFSCDTASDSTKAINNTIFMRYEIINRSTYTYNNTYIGILTDGDLGDPLDDYTGCNVELNTGYFFNGDASDGDGSGSSYGNMVPSQAITILNGPWAEIQDSIDNDHDGEIDEIWESLGMSKFMYFNNSGGVNGDPTSAQDCYNYLRGCWRDGTPLTYGGNGYQSSLIPANYMFPGNSDPSGFGTGGVPQPYWSEETEGNTPADRRNFMSMGPFTMDPGQVQYIDIAFVWSLAPSGDPGESLEENMKDVRNVISWYKSAGDWAAFSGGNFPSCYQYNQSAPEDLLQEQIFTVWPNPASTEVYILPQGPCTVTVYDMTGKIHLTRKISSLNLLDISVLPAGLYLIRAEGKESVQTEKLIVR